MKVYLSSYQKDWPEKFLIHKAELDVLLKDVKPCIEHIGSTAIVGMSAKPIIDIMVGIENENLNIVLNKLNQLPYTYVKAFTDGMPERRFFFRLRDNFTAKTILEHTSEITSEINDNKIAHIHIVHVHAKFWMRHIAFRDYCRAHPETALAYQNLKIELSKKDWQHFFDYNKAKSSFIQQIESQAIVWYLNQQKP